MPAGFPLQVEAFEGDKAETKTMLPVIEAFKIAHQLTDDVVDPLQLRRVQPWP